MLNTNKIAFSGRAGSGKDTAAGILTKYLTAADSVNKDIEIYVMKFAAPLYNILNFIEKKIGRPESSPFGSKDRTALQDIGSWMREHYGLDVFIKMLIEESRRILKSDNNKYIFITDLRYKNEAAALKEEGYTLVRIERQDSSKIVDNHQSENDLSADDENFDIIIYNDETIEELKAAVLSVFAH